MKSWNSAFNAQDWRVIIVIVQVGEVKIYPAAVEALREKERHHGTQFITKICGKTRLVPSCFALYNFHSQLSRLMPYYVPYYVETGCSRQLEWLRLEWTSSNQCTSSEWGRSSHFGDEPKTHPFPLPRDFSNPLSAPKFSPPTFLTSFLAHSISRARESSLSSKGLQRDVKHKAWGRWRAQHWRNVERRKQEECFIPNAEAKEER